jgi:hypothetical protein
VLWWLVGAVVVLGAWLVGRAVWSPGDTVGFGRVHFEWFSDVVIFWIFGVPLCLAGGWVLGSQSKGPRWIGVALVVVTVAGLGLLTFDASFAGICFDTGQDTCVVTRPAHFAHLASPLAVLALGAGVTLWRQRRSAEHPITGQP